MTSITNKIKSKYGTLKHYAKKRKLNYDYLRQVVSNKSNSPYIKNILRRDKFIK